MADVLPEVGKDQLGDDPWDDPIGVEMAGAFQLAHIPDCAAGSGHPHRPVGRGLASRTGRSRARPRPMASFVVGVTPDGLPGRHALPRAAAPGAVLRLVVFRQGRRARPASATRPSDLRVGAAWSAGSPLSRFTVDGFQTGRRLRRRRRTSDDGHGDVSHHHHDRSRRLTPPRPGRSAELGAAAVDDALAAALDLGGVEALALPSAATSDSTSQASPTVTSEPSA